MYTKQDYPVMLLIALMEKSGGIPIGMKQPQELLDCLERRGLLEAGFIVNDGYFHIWVYQNINEVFNLLKVGNANHSV
jgi:hypothetical protein